MIKTILVPVDFRVASLNTLRLALESFPEEKLKVLLIYSQHLDNSITDLLFHSPGKSIHSLLSPEFKEGLEILKNRFVEKIQELQIRPFYGHNKISMKNFLLVNQVGHIFIPKNYKFQTSNRVFDPTPLLKKMPVPHTIVDWNTNYKHTQQEQLFALFN